MNIRILMTKWLLKLVYDDDCLQSAMVLHRSQPYQVMVISGTSAQFAGYLSSYSFTSFHCGFLCQLLIGS